jgi:glycerol uptake facilitator protein
MPDHVSLPRQCLAELFGTLILVFFGVGSVHVAVLTGALGGLWQVAAVWGVAVALAVYAAGAISGAHLNPAITVAFAVFRKFPVSRVGPCVLSQLAGAFLGAAVLYTLYGGVLGPAPHGGVLAEFEASHAITRGAPGSEKSAMVYGEYFPNPAMVPGQFKSVEAVSEWTAMLAEGLGTALLALFIFALTDRQNPGRPGGTTMLAVFIGLALSIIIIIIAPLTQAGLNPARDFGPRLFSYLAGWGRIAIPGPRGGFFTVYILAPVLGASVGAACYEFLLRPFMIKSAGAAQAEQRGES